MMDVTFLKSKIFYSSLIFATNLLVEDIGWRAKMVGL